MDKKDAIAMSLIERFKAKVSGLSKKQRLIAWVILIAGAFLLFSNWSDSRKMRIVEKEILEKLNDPESAQFKSVLIKRPEAQNVAAIACIGVNSKNEFGGYAGYKYFVGVFDEGSGSPDVFSERDLMELQAQRDVLLEMKEKYPDEPLAVRVVIDEAKMSEEDIISRGDWADEILGDCLWNRAL